MKLSLVLQMKDTDTAREGREVLPKVPRKGV